MLLPKCQLIPLGEKIQIIEFIKTNPVQFKLNNPALMLLPIKRHVIPLQKDAGELFKNINV